MGTQAKNFQKLLCVQPQRRGLADSANPLHPAEKGQSEPADKAQYVSINGLPLISSQGSQNRIIFDPPGEAFKFLEPGI